jgi:hypothetical protein
MKKPQPAYLKSVSHAVFENPSTPETPFGRDANDRPIGIPVGPTVDEARAKEATERKLCVHGEDGRECLLCGTKEYAPMPARPEDIAEHERKNRLKKIEMLLQNASDTALITGKPVSFEWMARAMQNAAERMARENAPSKQEKPPLPCYRRILQLSRHDIADLFDRVVEVKEVPVEKKILINSTPVQVRADELQKEIANLNSLMKTRTAAWWKRHRPDEPKPDKVAMQRLKREDQRELNKKETERRELLRKLREWESNPENYTPAIQMEKVEVTFFEKYGPSLPTTFYTTDFAYVAKDATTAEMPEPGTYEIHTPEPGTYTRGLYDEILGLDDKLHAAPNRTSWSRWAEWENEVLLKAIECNLLKPDESLLKRYGMLRKVYGAADPDDDHDAERVLILKTGGGALGGATIYSRGYLRGRLRKLEDFDLTATRGGAGKGRPGEGPDTFLGNLDSGDVAERQGDE